MEDGNTARRPEGRLVAAGAAGHDAVHAHLYPNRADNEAYINLEIDLRPLDAYLAKRTPAGPKINIPIFI